MDYQAALDAVKQAAIDRNREIARLKLEENMTYKQISARYGISRARAHQIVQDYLAHITHPSSPSTSL